MLAAIMAGLIGRFRPTWGADLYAVVRSRVDATSKSAINPFATNAFKKMLKQGLFQFIERLYD